jgi:hypothetical protein
MRVYLPRIGTAPFVDGPVDELEYLASADRFGIHELTADPAAADVILFAQCHMVDWRLRAVREHPVTKRFWEKIMVYDQRDRPWRSFPGVYVSMPARTFDPVSQRAWGYFRAPDVVSPSADPDLLFSFVGSPTAPCRRQILDLSHPHGVVEESRDFMFWDSAAVGFAERRTRYQEVLGRSRFVLCPRGRGTSSFRLYEVLAAGRVPVIISDEWVPPRGPAWETCSIKWREGRTDGLIELLEERSQDWHALSSAAAEVHRQFFSAEASFHRIIDQCADLRGAGYKAMDRSQLRLRALVATFRERAARIG